VPRDRKVVAELRVLEQILPIFRGMQLLVYLLDAAGLRLGRVQHDLDFLGELGQTSLLYLLFQLFVVLVVEFYHALAGINPVQDLINGKLTGFLLKRFDFCYYLVPKPTNNLIV